ncbi:MAG: MFS transporter [Verrucomicrobia bacterium]|nr:MFS transporter [Verrucomicrobiota bacterium]
MITASKSRLPERALLLLLAAVQFTHIMDFMIMMPLGPQLMRVLSISASQFSLLIAAYTMTAGVIGFLTAPFIDRYDRRMVLLVSYAGFILGTYACASSESVGQLLLARAVCGAFGGISNATILAIVGDLVPSIRRGAAMGIIMTSFSAAAAFGVPFGLFLAQRFRWETPFYLVVGIALVVEILLMLWLPHVRGHLADGPPPSLKNFATLLSDSNAWRGILLMVSLVFGHFTIIPFLSPHLVSNLKYPESHLALVYVVGGVLTIVTAPMIGRLSDRFGRARVFTILVIVAATIISILTHAGPLPVSATLVITGLFFVFASGRYVPAQAVLTSAVPAVRRGAFMSLTACTRDLCSGLAAMLAGRVVVQTSGGLLHVGWLGWLAVGTSLLSIWLIRRVRTVADHYPPANQSAVPLGVAAEG